MATTRRESSSAYSTSSQTTQQQGTFNFVPPAVAGSVRQIPQQYPFVSQSRRQPSNLSSVSEDFPATLTSMESSSSEYAPRARRTGNPQARLPTQGRTLVHTTAAPYDSTRRRSCSDTNAKAIEIRQLRSPAGMGTV
jgi:hypothetical protein